MFALLLYLKELYSDTGEHKLEQCCDDNNVADGPDGHKHALHNMLENTKKLIVNTNGRCVLFMCVTTVCAFICVSVFTFSPLALLMALSGLSTRRTLRIFTTLIALDLKHTWD